MEDHPLTTKQIALIPIAAFTANGDSGKLPAALQSGLAQGLTINEIKEVLVQMYAYAGFPRSLNGLSAFMQLLAQRQQQGFMDEMGPEPDPLPTDKSRVAYGTEIQTALVGSPVTGELMTFAPAIDEFLKSHLFGDIFGRGILDFPSREIATIAALSALSGVDGQLQSHLHIGLNVGLTPRQIHQIISTLAQSVSHEASQRAAQAYSRLTPP